MRWTLIFLPGVLALSSACAAAPSAPREALAQQFVLERDLAGQTTARGEFRTITGVIRPFTAHLEGEMQGDVFVLTEHFLFDDGERDVKTWRLRQVAPGLFEGAREDVIGVATGRQDGDFFRLEYDVRLPTANGRGRVVRFRDILYLTPSGVGNTASVGWFGLRVGSVTLEISRNTEAPAAR